MAQNATVTVTRTWTQLTNADATSITISNRGSEEIEIMGAASASAPAASDGVVGILMERGTAVVNRTLADLFPGITTPVRVYARTHPGGTSYARVGHA